jgi:hypothetical protein
MRNSIVRNIHIALKMLRKISTTEKKTNANICIFRLNTANFAFLFSLFCFIFRLSRDCAKFE